MPYILRPDVKSIWYSFWFWAYLMTLFNFIILKSLIADKFCYTRSRYGRTCMKRCVTFRARIACFLKVSADHFSKYERKKSVTHFISTKSAERVQKKSYNIFNHENSEWNLLFPLKIISVVLKHSRKKWAQNGMINLILNHGTSFF